MAGRHQTLWLRLKAWGCPRPMLTCVSPHLTMSTGSTVELLHSAGGVAARNAPRPKVSLYVSALTARAWVEPERRLRLYVGLGDITCTHGATPW